MPGVRARRRADRGAASIEFALVVIPFLLLVFGIIQYGLFFWSYQGGSDVARTAARQAAVSQPSDCAAFVTTTKAQVGSLTDSAPSVTVHRSYSDGPGHLASGNAVQVGDYVNVSVSFMSHNLHLPLIPLPNSGQVTATAKSRVEYVDAPVPGSC